MQSPLADTLRPKKFSEFVGQEHLVGKEGVIRRLLEKANTDRLFPSLIFWGPPGSGKTTLARLIASSLERNFYEFSAVNTSIKDVEKIIPKKEDGSTQLDFVTQVKKQSAPIVFVDEIHRFNKAQQDVLLPHIERGIVILIGATTENPSFEVIGPLLSRTRVLVLNQLSEKEIAEILKRAEKHLGIVLTDKIRKFLIESSNGDARVAITVLDIAKSLSRSKRISLEDIEQALQRRQLTFDKQGEEYYNVISAFIKSMRASNVDAALYYLARMVEAGQDPLYIARRMVIFASEDIGMAQPIALVVANDVFRACETIGYPECQENLAHGTVFLALAKKDRSAYDAYMEALGDVKKYGNLPVPMKIRNAPTKLMKELGYGKGYEKYTKESLLPDKLKGRKYFKG